MTRQRVSRSAAACANDALPVVLIDGERVLQQSPASGGDIMNLVIFKNKMVTMESAPPPPHQCLPDQHAVQGNGHNMLCMLLLPFSACL